MSIDALSAAAEGARGVRQSRLLLNSLDHTTQQCSGAAPSRHFRLDGEINESTVHCCFAEREDRPDAPCRLSNGSLAGPAARFTRMAATPKQAPSPHIGIACPAAWLAPP